MKRHKKIIWQWLICPLLCLFFFPWVLADIINLARERVFKLVDRLKVWWFSEP